MADGMDNNERELIIRVKESDHDAFKALCRIYYQPLCRYLFRRTLDREASFDLVQELFINVWKNRHRLNENQPVKAYLYKAATNLSVNHLKSRTARRTSAPGDMDLHPESAGNSSPDSALYLEDILSRLPENERTVFELNKFDGMKYSEIAEMLKVSVKTVEARMSRALKSLRKLLRP
ncbi:MAG: RNA polymerase sigma factor [Syntrophothermus sp.]